MGNHLFEFSRSDEIRRLQEVLSKAVEVQADRGSELRALTPPTK
jgi:hypothetical protein